MKKRFKLNPATLGLGMLAVSSTIAMIVSGKTVTYISGTVTIVAFIGLVIIDYLND